MAIGLGLSDSKNAPASLYEALTMKGRCADCGKIGRVSKFTAQCDDCLGRIEECKKNQKRRRLRKILGQS